MRKNLKEAHGGGKPITCDDQRAEVEGNVKYVP